MPTPLPPHIVQVDSRRIRIGDRVVLTTFPIDHLTMVGDRLVLAVERHGEEWLYQSFSADPVRPFDPRRPYAFGAQVARGTRLSLPADHNCGLILPSGREVDLPGAVRSVAEAPEGFVVLVDMQDVPIDNAFFVDRDGAVRWQVQPNPFAGHRTSGGYTGVSRTVHGTAYLEIDHFGYFRLDVRDGSIKEHVITVPKE